ncbi:MAG: hypothetical protein GF331_08415 [Chitinivibrionales bacterium]|nr:hypothetical protein [Chitinivibrionales bacterium]
MNRARSSIVSSDQQRHRAVPGWTTLALLALVAVTAMVPGCTESEDPVAPDVESDREILTGEIQEMVEDLMSLTAAARGLSFVRPVYATILTDDEYSAQMDEDEGWQEFALYADDFLSMLTRMGYSLRDYPISDFAALMQDFYAGFPYAFYATGTDTMTILCETDACTAIREDMQTPGFTATICHELTHALQDQHFGLQTQPGATETTDRADGWRSLVEGDASLTEDLCMELQGYVRQQGVAAVQYCRSMADTFYSYVDSIDLGYPDFMEIPAFAPYYLGTSWIARRYGQGGWSQVDVLFDQLPLSLLQTMSYDTFTTTTISLTRFEQFVNKYDFWSEDVCGPLDVSVIFDQFDSTGTSSDNIRRRYGYRGDHMLYWYEPGATEGTLLWAFAFADSLAAKGGYALVSRIASDPDDISLRPTGTGVTSDSLVSLFDDHATFDCGEYHSIVARSGSMVWWIENAGSSRDAIVQEALVTPLAKLRSVEPVRAHNPVHRFRRRRGWRGF